MCCGEICRCYRVRETEADMDELARDRARWKGEIVLSWKDIGLVALGILSLVALVVVMLLMLRLGMEPPAPSLG